MRTTLQNALTLIGLSCLLAWLQVSEALCTAHETTEFPSCMLASFVAVATLAIYGLLNHFTGFKLSRLTLLLVAATAVLSGFIYAFFSVEYVRQACLCLHMICGSIVAVFWGTHLATLRCRTLIPLVCIGAGLSVILLSLPQILSLSYQTLGTAATLLAGAGIILWVSTLPSKAGNKALSTEHAPVSGNTAQTPLLSVAPFKSNALPQIALTALFLSVLTASAFGGFAANLYLIDSPTVSAYALIASLALLALIGIRSRLYFCRDKHSKEGVSAQRERPENREQDTNHKVALLFYASSGLLLLVITAGLLLFFLQTAAAPTRALGLILGAKGCLLFLCWVVFPLTIAQNQLPAIPSFALFMLASGMLYAHCLSTGISSILQIELRSLANSSAVLATVFALLAAFFITLWLCQRAEAQHAFSANTLAQTDPLSRKAVENALLNHMLEIMKPYKLTMRQEEIVLLIVAGKTRDAIAKQLTISEHTVKYHSKEAYKKLGVHSKEELIRLFSES